MQTAVSVHCRQCALPSCRHLPLGSHTMVSSAAVCNVRPMAHALLCTVNGDDSTVYHSLSLVTLTFDLNVQTRPSEGPNTSTLWMWCKSVQQNKDIWGRNKKKSQTPLKTEPSLHAVTILPFNDCTSRWTWVSRFPSDPSPVLKEIDWLSSSPQIHHD